MKDKYEPIELTVKEKKLLGRVVSFYQHTLSEDTACLDYIKSLGIKDNKTIQDFTIGYANGTLKEILPEDENVITTLKKIGILDKRGKETFINSLVLPLHDEKKDFINLYGINISDGQDKILSQAQGLINQQALKRSDSIILTNNVIDALILYDQGFYNVIPVFKPFGLPDGLLSNIKEVYIVFHANEHETPVKAFPQPGIAIHNVQLPEQDITTYFKRHTPEEFENLLKDTNPSSTELSDKINNREQNLYIHQEHGFMVGYGRRQYHIKGIQRGNTQLKITIKVAQNIQDKHSPFELSTIDLYSSKSRQWFAKLCAGLLECSEELVREDISKILTLVEDWKPKVHQLNPLEPTKEEKEQALSFLNNPEMLSEILSDFEIMGVMGEETNKLVGYLSATSRKLSDPLSVLVQSRSAAGKSTIQDAILSLIPDEDYIKYTRVTDQALFYKDENSLVNKILAIEEASGMGRAAYSIRTIQSAKKITVAATGKDQATGKMRTEEYTVKGPVAIMITTTAIEVEQETASRFIFLTIDESKEMTQ